MTLGDWLDSRVPPPPAALVDALRTELRDDLGAQIEEMPAVLLQAGERVLKRVLQTNPQSPAIAPDLLLADALVTYAFEVVAESASNADSFARDAMTRISALSDLSPRA